MKNFLKNKYLELLDFVAPLESWLALLLFPGEWISHLARRHVSKNIHKPSLNSILKKDQFAISLPENSVESVTVAGLLVFGIPIAWTIISLMFPALSHSHYGLLNMQLLSAIQIGWQVLASLMGITFVVVVFVLQYANERKYEGLASPLFFIETKIIFIASFGLLTILYNGVSSVLFALSAISEDYLAVILFWNFVLFAVNIISSLYVFVQAIRIITPNYFQERFRIFINHRISAFVGLEIEERFSELIFLDESKKLDLEVPYFPPMGNNNNKVELKNLSRHINVISDVNLRMLKVVAKRAKGLLENYKKHDVIFFGKTGHRVGMERQEIAYVHPDLNRPLITEFIRRSVKYIPIEKANKRSLAGEIVLNGKLIRNAIESQDSNMVAELLEHYRNAIEAFLEAIQSYDVHYSLDTANKENSYFFDWAVLSTIEDQYIDLIDIAIRCNDQKVVRSFLAFPFHVLGLAIRYRDHLVFKRVSEIIPVIYRHSLSLGETLKYKPIIDYCVDNLIAIQQFHLELSLKHADTENEIRVLVEYLIQGYVVWRNLMKIAIDSRDSRQFELLCQTARQTPSHFFSTIDAFKIDELETSLKIVDEEGMRDKFELELRRARYIMSLRGELGEVQTSMFLGVGTWLTHLFDKKKISIDEYMSFMSSVNAEFLTVNELHAAYLAFHAGRWERLFDWTSWEMNEWEGRVGEVKSGSIHFSSWVLLYYSVRGIELTYKDSSSSPSLTLSYLNQTICEGIERESKYVQDSEQWKSFILKMAPIDVSEKIHALMRLHQTAIREQEIKDEIDVRDAALSERLVKKFQEDVVAAWRQTSTLRKVVQAIGKYHEYKEIYRDETKVFGVRTLSLKGEFIEGEQNHYFSQGEYFGREMANTDNHKLVIPILSAQLSEYDISDFSYAISSAIKKLREDGYSPIVLTNHRNLAIQFYEAKEFLSRWLLQNNSYNNVDIFGKFDDAYVFDVPSMPANTLAIIDISAFGVLNQYGVSGSVDFPLNISVKQLTPADAESILQKNPKWSIHPVTGEEISYDAAIRKILQYVSIQIWEDCMIEEIDLKAVIRIGFRNVKIE